MAYTGQVALVAVGSDRIALAASENGGAGVTGFETDEQGRLVARCARVFKGEVRPIPQPLRR